jgi:hypothetical protein
MGAARAGNAIAFRNKEAKTMRVISPAAAAALISASIALMPSASQAAVPKLSGTYLIQLVKNCGSGVIGLASGTWTFIAASKTYKNSLSFSSGVPPMSITPSAASGTYSNTATEVTFGGSSGSAIYHAYYGALSSAGVATSAEMIAAVGSGQCTVQINFLLR